MNEYELMMPSKDTKSKILRFLSEKDLTALDIAERLDVNESAVRRHLDKLESLGMVNHDFKKVGRGRPKKFFRLTEKGMRAFPREPELLLNLLIKNLDDDLDEDVFEDISKNIADGLKDHFPETSSDESLEKKIEKVVQGFNDLGFYCSFDQKNGSYSIKYKNCAFGRIPQEQGTWLCKVHRMLLHDLLDGADLEQPKSMMIGDKICLQNVGD